MHAVSAAEEEAKIKINLAGLDLATVAKQVERVTKRTFLFDDNLLRSKRVTLQSDTPITPSEFYRVFQSVCQLNGFVIIPVEGSGINLEKIIAAQGALKEPGAQPVIVRGETLPAGDSMMSYLVKLQNVPATKIMAILTPELSATGTVLQVPNSELLMVNDVASSVKRMEKILSLVDVPGDPVTVYPATIINMPVERAQTLLTEYMQALNKAKNGEGGKDHLSIVKDERLNVLHLLGPEADVVQAKAFLKILDVDSPAARRTIKYYKLKNVPVKELVDYVSELLGIALASRPSDESGTPNPSHLAPERLGPAIPPSPVTGNPNAPSLPPAGTPPVATFRNHDASKKNGSSNLPADIVAVEGLNMLVVAGDASVHKEVETILQNLDRRKGQVLIEVAIVQVTGQDTMDLGTEFLSLNDLSAHRKVDGGTGFGLGTQSDATANGTTTGTGTGSTTGTGVTVPLRGFPTQSVIGSVAGSAFRFVNGDKFQVILNALSTKSNVSIVSQPLLLVNDNEEASFTTKVSQPTVTTSQGTATTNTSFSGFADATTSLKITPHISADGYMNLEIVQTVEEFTGPPAGAGIPPPKVSNNATTKVCIPDRQTIVVGGFTRDESDNSKSGIPGLMNMPGLGHLFSKTSKQKVVSRLYLFVRPKILTNVSFSDLEAESEMKKDEVDKLSKDTKIKKEINERLENRAEVIEVPENGQTNGR